jgi:mRNA interferase RelE/StbE
MSYSISFDKRAEKELNDLPVKMIKRVDLAIQKLAIDPRPTNSKKLAGHQPGAWRIRVGDYRILYHIDDDLRQVAVYKVAKREKTYKE